MANDEVPDLARPAVAESVLDEAAALELARSAHAGQVDKLGRDYVEAHLIPIGESLREHGSAAVAAGYLHDILEDTPHTPESLRAHGVPEQVISAVEAVTRRSGEPYELLIARAQKNSLGRLVKLADNAHNLAGNAELAMRDPETAARLKVRYQRAREVLLSFEPDLETPDTCPYCDVRQFVTLVDPGRDREGSSDRGQPARLECRNCGCAWSRAEDGSPAIHSIEDIYEFAQDESHLGIANWIDRVLNVELPSIAFPHGSDLTVGFSGAVESVSFPTSLDALWGLLAELHSVALLRSSS